jgi:hypothetical protein
MIRGADARRMRIAMARVAAVDKEATSDLNAGVRRQSAPSEWSLAFRKQSKFDVYAPQSAAPELIVQRNRIVMSPNAFA